MCLVACEGVQTHTFARNDGVGYFIHGPLAGHMLHLDLNYRHGQADVTCDYVLNFQIIPIGGEPVNHPPALGHPLLVPFGYPRDPASFQVLIWNVRDISLGFNRSLVRGLIANLNPAVLFLAPFRILSSSLSSLAMTSPRHLAVFRSRLEGVTPPPVRSIQADDIGVLLWSVSASGFDYMCAFVRDLRPSVLILVERDAQDADVLASFARSLGYSTVLSRWDSDDRQPCWIFCHFGVTMRCLRFGAEPCHCRLSARFFCENGHGCPATVGFLLAFFARTSADALPLLYAPPGTHCLTRYGPSQFAISFPSVGSVRARVASLSTRSPTSSFRCLTFLLCASAAFCLSVAALMLAMSHSSSARSKLTFRAA
ncbi:uncharacterized protein G2W53_033496 [Senna tora]|uniref:Uncharacterized protein n=1 Tax=Senna tora TaxID=362788 RepID=A0A834T0P1_9FABA|nr:uncharacterized protein G2W53_033496 [Senna tora]